jgi:hypothetical protein
VCEDDHAHADAVLSSTVNPLAPTAPAAADDDTPDEVQGDSSGSGDEAGMP